MKKQLLLFTFTSIISIISNINNLKAMEKPEEEFEIIEATMPIKQENAEEFEIVNSVHCQNTLIYIKNETSDNISVKLDKAQKSINIKPNNILELNSENIEKKFSINSAKSKKEIYIEDIKAKAQTNDVIINVSLSLGLTGKKIKLRYEPKSKPLLILQAEEEAYKLLNASANSTCYQILQLNEDACPEEIRKASSIKLDQWCNILKEKKTEDKQWERNGSEWVQAVKKAYINIIDKSASQALENINKRIV